MACDGPAVSTSDLVKAISKAFGKKNNVMPIPGMFQKLVKSVKPEIHRRLFGNLKVDNTKTSKTFNYQPEYSIDQGIREMVDWYNSQKKP